MPRGPRLDSPGLLHHVVVRGIERPWIFRAATQAERILAYVRTERLAPRRSDLARALDETCENVSLAADRAEGQRAPGAA